MFCYQRLLLSGVFPSNNINFVIEANNAFSSAGVYSCLSGRWHRCPHTGVGGKVWSVRLGENVIVNVEDTLVISVESVTVMYSWAVPVRMGWVSLKCSKKYLLIHNFT